MTEMLFSKDELYNWMTLALRLCDVRLRELNLNREPEMYLVLMDEVKVRRFCLKNSGQADEFQGAARAWWKYMVAKAKLEILWERRYLTEEEFRRAAVALRTKRDQDLIRTADGLWLPPLRRESA